MRRTDLQATDGQTKWQTHKKGTGRYTQTDRQTDRQTDKQTGRERRTFIFSMMRLVPRMVYRFSGFCLQCFSAHVVFPAAGRPIIISTWRR